MGDFLCVPERVKHFVEAHLHYIFRNLKKDKRNIDVALPLGKISADAHGQRYDPLVLGPSTGWTAPC